MGVVKSSLFFAILISIFSSSTAFAQTEGEAPPPEQAPQVATPEAGVTPPPSQRSVESLIADLSNPDPQTRSNAVRALGDRRAVEATGALVQILRGDPLPEVRGWAVRALHDIGTPESRGAVVTAARQDPDERVRTMAARLENVQPAQTAQGSPFAGNQAVVQQQQQQAYAAPRPQPRVRRRPPGQRLSRVGIVMTSASYGLALLVGISMLAVGNDEPVEEWEEPTDWVDWGWKMILPVAGPPVAATTNVENGGVAVPFFLWSAIQIAGIAIMAVGLTQRSRYLREQGDEEEEASRRFGIALAPGGPGGPGMTLAGWF